MSIKFPTKILWLLCLAVCLGAWQAARAQAVPLKYLHHSWTTEEGLPQNNIRPVQTRDGYLWLKTFGGLARFDGVKFTIFDTGNTPALRSNRILSFSEDAGGTLWIGTQNGGLTRYSKGVFHTYTTKDGLPDESIYDLLADDEGRLWISTPKGLACLSNGVFKVYKTHDGLPTDGSGYLRKGVNGTLWFIAGDYLMRYQAGNFTGYRDINGFARDWPQHLAGIHAARDGSVWLATKYGLARFHDGAFTVLKTYPVWQSRLPPAETILSIYEEPDGRIRFLTRRGLAHFQNGEIIFDTVIPELESLIHDFWAVEGLVSDRESNLWLGVSGKGLHRFRPRTVSAYAAEEGLSDQPFLPMTVDGAGGMWMAGGDVVRTLFRWQGGKFTSFDLHASARSLYQDGASTLWIGTDTKGIYRLEEGKLLTSHPLNEALSGIRVNAIYRDRAGHLWVGSGGDEGQVGSLYRLGDKGDVTRYQTSEGLVANDVRFITEDRAGALWIGTTGGLSRFKDGRFTNYTTEQGLSNNYVRDIYEDADGTLWIGTYGGGLNRFKDGRFTHLTVREGLFDNVVSRILEDEGGNFWMSGNRGIFRASRKELNDFADGRASVISCSFYGVADGMKTSETNGGGQPAGWKDQEGKLWFPTIKGVVVIDPRQLNRLPPPVFIEQVFIGKTPFDPLRQKIEVRPGQNGLEIHYTGLSLTAPEKVRFRYKLEGHDKDWVDAGTRRIAYFTNLLPGRYTFRVMASNNDGVWSVQDATIELVVIPPFWRTWWFISLVVLFIMTLAYLLYRRRVAQLKRARAAQEAFSKQLIESQEQERKRIAAELHDSLGQDLLIIKNRAVLGLKMLPEDAKAKEQIEQIAGTASQAITEVRQIAYNLRPYHLDEIGLTQSLEELVERISNSCPIKFTTSIDYIDDICPKDSAINLYRIVQEAINNIVKHSEADEARLVIRRSEREIEVVIQDNGKGFTAANGQAGGRARNGFGLTGLVERARILGGTLDVHSIPRKGTTVTLVIRAQGGKP